MDEQKKDIKFLAEAQKSGTMNLEIELTFRRYMDRQRSIHFLLEQERSNYANGNLLGAKDEGNSNFVSVGVDLNGGHNPGLPKLIENNPSSSDDKGKRKLSPD